MKNEIVCQRCGSPFEAQLGYSEVYDQVVDQDARLAVMTEEGDLYFFCSDCEDEIMEFCGIEGGNEDSQDSMPTVPWPLCDRISQWAEQWLQTWRDQGTWSSPSTSITVSADSATSGEMENSQEV